MMLEIQPAIEIKFGQKKNCLRKIVGDKKI